MTLKNSMKKEIFDFINLENKISNIISINKNFLEIIINLKPMINLKQNFNEIIEEINFNRKSLDEIKDILDISDEAIFLDFVRFILFKKYKNAYKVILHGKNF